MEQETIFASPRVMSYFLSHEANRHYTSMSVCSKKAADGAFLLKIIEMYSSSTFSKNSTVLGLLIRMFQELYL